MSTWMVNSISLTLRSSERPFAFSLSFSGNYDVILNLEPFPISHTVPLLLGEGLSKPSPGLYDREVFYIKDC